MFSAAVCYMLLRMSVAAGRRDAAAADAVYFLLPDAIDTAFSVSLCLRHAMPLLIFYYALR